MHFNWSAFDGVLGVVLLIIVVWAALKLVTRVVVGLVLLVVIAVIFFGLHFGDFGSAGG